MDSSESEVQEALAAITRAWRENRPSEMRSYLHPDIAMVFPGFTGTVVGRDAMLAGFDEWCSNARVLEYKESDEQIQIIGHVGFASFRFDMLYERSAYQERSTGRDVWAFERVEGKWIAVWRTMIELKEDRRTKE